MPIDVNLPDGRVIVFPDDTTQEVIERTAKRAIDNPESLRTTKELEAVPAAPSTLRDINEAAAMGLASGIKGLSDIFGVGNVVSKKMEELQREAYGRLTPERQRELAIEDELARRASEEGMLAEAKQAGRSFLRSPIQQGIGAAFSSAPIIAATALAPEATIPAVLAGRTGLGAAAARTAISSAPAIGVGAAMGVGSQKGQDYERVKQAMLEQGASEADAEAAAQKAAEYSMQNAARQAAAGLAGGAEGALGIESLLGRAGRARAGVRGGPEAPTWGRAAAQSTLGEAVPEAIQNVVGTVGSNVALQQAGIDTDLFKGATGEAVSGALAAALMGSAVTPLQMRQLRQEFARDQLEKQMEEQKKAFDALQKQQAQVAKTKEELGTPTALALPAPAPKVEEKDPLQNPLGNLTKDELGPEVVKYIEQYRSANGMPLLNTYSIEDVRDAMTQVNPEGEAAALDSLVAAKSGYQPDVTYSAQDVLNAATNKVDTTTQGFRDFLNRTTGNSDLNTMSQPQLYAAFKALENVPVGQGLTILPEGSNASRFTETQMVQGLDAVATEIGKSKEKSVTPEQAITRVKEATGLKNDRDAATLIKQLVKDNNLDSNADGNLVAPTEITNLPAGYTLEKGTFKQSDQQLYGVLSDGKPLEGVDTYTNPEDAQAKVEALNKTREKQAEVVQQQIKRIQDQIDQSQQDLDAMEAAGEGGTDAYKQAKAQHEAMVSKVTDNINNLQARQMMFQTPLTMGPVGMKQVNRTGFTLFKDGVPVSTHPTADAALDSLVGTMPEADVATLAQEKAPGMRTLARKARQRLEQKEKPVAPKKAEEKKPEGAKPEGAEEAKTLAEQLAPILKKFGLGDLQLQIVKGMEEEGSYTARLIRIALDAKDAIGVLRHESIHALKDLGFFTDAQWKSLVRMANDKWVDQHLRKASAPDGRSRFDAYQEMFKEEADRKGLTGKDADNYVQNALIEEAIADAFRAFGKKPPPGMLTAILNKIKQFFQRLKGALNAAGYESAEDIFGKIEAGQLKPSKEAEAEGKLSLKPNSWKADKADIEQAEEYFDENGILPYTSEGQLTVPLEGSGTKFSIKMPYTQKEIERSQEKAKAQANAQVVPPEGKKVKKVKILKNDPITGLPLNQDGTVTLYYPTTNEGARELAQTKKLRGHSPTANRIYLTNESGANIVADNPGMIDQPLGGANVLLMINPSLLELAQEYDNGRKDFYLPIAEGEYFAKKAKTTKLFTLNAPRTKGLHADRRLSEVTESIEKTVNEWNSADKKTQDQMFKDAKDTLMAQHNVSILFGANAKLEKTNIGEYGLTYDGKSVMSTGLGFASAQKISDKTQESTCPKSAICEALCLGETSGQNELYGGEGPFRSGPRLSQFLKTEAFIVNPEAFTVSLIRQIEKFKQAAKDVDHYPSIRLNVTSDFPGRMFKPIMDMFPDVMFYDYTKLISAKPVAPNHHLTYSSTGASQVLNADKPNEELILNKESNWDQLVNKVLNEGKNVAMAFTSRTDIPKFVMDEKTGQKFEVWNGDEYDARFLDPQRPDGVGWIIGLTNKDRTTAPEDSAKKHNGFFLDYNKERDGDTLIIKNQDKLAGKPSGKVFPIAKKSLRAPETKEFKRWFGNSKVVDEDGNPLVVYHGTGEDFSVFKYNKLKSLGTWFAKQSELASQYSELVARQGKSPSVMPVYLSIKNPATEEDLDEATKLAETEKGRDFSKINKRRREILQAQGFDGVILSDAYVVFEPEQIKSAIGNIGTYDITNPDIRKSLRAPDTKEFKQFFGDSKVVDENGNPLVVYHGTGFDFDVFEGAKKGTEKAYFFSQDPELASDFARTSAGSYEGNANVIPAFIRMENPLVVDYKGSVKWGNDALMRQMLSQVWDGKYDGVIAKNVIDGSGNPTTIYAVIKPNQIKSATGNIGTYDITNPDIRKSLRAPKWVPQNIWDLHEKSLAADAEASGEIARPKGISPGAAKRNQTMAFRRLNNAVMEFVGDDENKANDLMVRMNEESSRREGETEKKSLRAFNPDNLPENNKDYALPENTILYHGAYKSVADAIKSVNYLMSRPTIKAHGGTTDEGGLVWFGSKESAQNYADSKADPIKVQYDREAGITREPGQVFQVITDKPYRLISRYKVLSKSEAEDLNEALRLPDYKSLEAGDSAETAASRAHNYRNSNIDRYTVATGKREQEMSAPWPVILKTLNADGFYSNKTVTLTAENGIRLSEDGKPMERFSLRAPDTKEFNDWFDESKVVNKEGKPMVMYHGTARDIEAFKPKQAGAIFVTPDPAVGSIYSADSFDWISKNAKDELTEEQQAKAKADALAAAEEDFSYLRDPAERKQPDYKKLVAKRDAILKDIEKNSFTNKRLSEEALPYLATAVKDYLPTGPNIMPVFVRALRPFDYENKKHLDMVIDYLAHNYTFPGEVSERVKEEAKKMGMPTEFSGNKLAALKSHIARGLYQKIESEPVQRAIRALKFDSFYVKEHGVKNLGVYSPVQLKSATGNIGSYDVTNPDIRKSLRPNVPNDIQRRINEKIAVRDEKTWLQNLLSAIVPSESDAFRQAAINRYQRIATREKLAAKEDKIEQYTADMSAEFAALHSDYAAELMASAMGIHDGKGGIPVYRNGMTMIWNDNGKITGPLDIFQPLAKLNDPKVFQDWQFWKSAHRGVRLDVVSGKPTQFGKDDLAEAKRLESLYPEGLFKQVDQAWDRYNRGLVDYMVQTGVISRKMGDEWVKHGDYFPFYRQQMDEDAKGPKMFSAISGVKAPKELKGGEGTVGDFFENIIRNTQSAIEAGMKNVAAQRAIDNELKIKGAEEVVGFKGEPKRPTSMTNVVTVLKNGETHYYECVDKLFVEAMKGLNMAEIPGLWLLSAPANWLRSFVTKTPDFILANLLRDSMSAWVTSGANITPVIDTAKGFGAALAGTDPDMKVLFDAGLIGGHEFSGKARETGKSLAKELRKRAGVKTTKEKILTPVTAVWEALEKGSTASDAATRLAVYKDTMAQTGNQAEAIRRAMEIMNFQRKGNSALLRILTAAVPFLNARIQGIDVLYRAGIKPFVDPKNASEYEKAVAKAFLKRGAMMMTLSIMYYMMVRDDEDYLAQEEETRDNNWIIPGLGVKIPIPFEVGIIFKTMPERITALMMGNDTGAQFMDSMTRNIQSTFGIQLPQAVLPLIEVATGYSFFTHRQITPAGLEDVAKQYQVGPSTSRLAEVLGQFTSMTTATGKSIGLSPIELDHLLKGYTGTMGTYFADAVDVVINANSDIPAASKRFEQMPFIRRFALDPEARGNVTAYYELKNAVDEAVRTSNLLERTGKVEDFVRYQEENMPLLASKDYVNALYKSMKEFNQMKQQIRASSMDADDKRDALLAVEQAEAALVSQIKEYRKMIAQ